MVCEVVKRQKGVFRMSLKFSKGSPRLDRIKRYSDRMISSCKDLASECTVSHNSEHCELTIAYCWSSMWVYLCSDRRRNMQHRYFSIIS